MVEAFNEGLGTQDFKFYMAAGRSAAQLAKYQDLANKFTAQTGLFANTSGGGVAHIFNRRWHMEIDGLDFGGKAAPKNWREVFRNVMAPTHETAPSMVASMYMHDLHLGHPHLFLGAMIKGEEDYKFLVPVVRPVVDGWVVASPIVDGKAFVPQDAVEIDLMTYAIMTGQNPAKVESPATDAAFKPRFMQAYPFKARETQPAPATA